MISRIAVFSGLLLLAATEARAQFAPLKTKLKQQTADEFSAYAKNVEAGLNARWNGKAPFLSVDKAKLKSSEIIVEPGVEPNPSPITDGLVHDWYGAVFIPNTTIAKVLSVLQDFDHHSKIYPQVIKSKLINRTGDNIIGYWRLEQKGQMVPAVFDVTQVAQYKKLSADKVIAMSYANDIRAVENNGKVLPPGEGMGLMWKLYSYWSIEQESDGVIAECRTVSLSRGVPGGVAWMIRPFINTIPRDSMESTLRNTKKAATE